MNKFGDAQASRVIQALETRATRKLRDGAQIATTWGTVAEISADQKTAGAYLYGENTSEYVSGGFRVPETTYLTVGDVVKVAMNYATGERWIDEVHYPDTSYKKAVVDIRNGSFAIGNGSSAPDIRIGRSSARQMVVDANGVTGSVYVNIRSTSGTDSGLVLLNEGHSVAPVALITGNTVPNLQFGGGSGNRDVRLRRSAAGTVILDDNDQSTTAGLQVRGAAGLFNFVGLYLTGDNYERATLRGDGAVTGLLLGSGAAAQDVTLYRQSGNPWLRYLSGGEAAFIMTATGSAGVGVYGMKTGDTNYRWYLSDGGLNMGSGSATPDVQLYRSAANVLRTPDTLSVDTGLIVNGGQLTLHQSGYFEGVEIAEPSAPGADFGRMYFRDNGSGKTQLVAKFSSGAVQVIATQP